MQAVTSAPAARPSGGYRELVIENALASCSLFSGTPTKDLESLVRIAWVKSLGAGEWLFHEGDPNRAVYVVQSGAVRLFRVNAAGHEQVVRIARPRESFAEESLFAAVANALNATAITASRLVVLPRNEFLALARTSPLLMARIAQSLSEHVRDMIGLLDDLRLKSARARLAKWLLEQCKDPGSDEPMAVELSIPKRVVASELGMASETFSRALAELQHSHLIAVEGRKVVLLCPRQLGLKVVDSDERSEHATPDCGFNRLRAASLAFSSHD